MNDVFTIEEILEHLKSSDRDQDELSRLNSYIIGFMQAAVHYLEGRDMDAMRINQPDYWERGYNTFIDVLRSGQ